MAQNNWPWKIAVLATIAVVDLIVVLLYGAGTLDPTDIGNEVRVFHIVLVGLVIMLGLLGLGIWMLINAFQEDEHLDELDEAIAEADHEQEPVVEPDEPEDDVEILATDDQYEGRSVVEIARPPKHSVHGGIYATTYLSVNDSYVVRLEDLVAVQRG